MTYGAAGDRDGNGWWAEMSIDIIGKGNMTTGKPEEVRLEPVKEFLDNSTPEARAATRPSSNRTSTIHFPGRKGRGAL